MNVQTPLYKLECTNSNVRFSPNETEHTKLRNCMHEPRCMEGGHTNQNALVSFRVDISSQLLRKVFLHWHLFLNQFRICQSPDSRPSREDEAIKKYNPPGACEQNDT